MARVHASLPLSGPARHVGRPLRRGLRLALEAAVADVELVVHDTGGDLHGGREAAALEHARAAVADPQALAYVGDVHSSQVACTAPVLASAGLLHVAPVATKTGLTSGTLVLLMPDDRAGAAAIAAWLARSGTRSALVVHDHDDDYGRPVGAMCAEALGGAGIEARARPVWDHGEPMAPDVQGAGAVVYAGVAGSGAPRLWHDLHDLDPRLWLVGTEGVATPWLARELAPGPAARTRFFVSRRAAWDLYGLEAMGLVLDAIAAGGGDRAAVAAAARTTRDRPSALGRYSIGPDGRTTSTAYGRLRVVDGELDDDVG